VCPNNIWSRRNRCITAHWILNWVEVHAETKIIWFFLKNIRWKDHDYQTHFSEFCFSIITTKQYLSNELSLFSPYFKHLIYFIILNPHPQLCILMFSRKVKMCQKVRCRFLWRWHKFYSIHKKVDNISGILGNVCLSCSIMDLFCMPFSPLLVNKRCHNEIWRQDIDQLSF
jgi:hypothetical protein